jgi:rubredoxin
MFRTVDFGSMQTMRCQNCGRTYSQQTKEKMKIRGWQRHWSFKKFCWIWICPICAAEKGF